MRTARASICSFLASSVLSGCREYKFHNASLFSYAAGSMERSNVGTSTNSHGPSIIADTAVRWSSMNGAGDWSSYLAVGLLGYGVPGEDCRKIC